MSTPLAEKMRIEAAARGPEDGLKLRTLADELDAQDGSNIPTLLRAWAKARRAFCEATGEPLI